jgi:hypothetical protein
VKARRVHIIRDELLNTPGPPLIEGAAALYRTIWNEGSTPRRASKPGKGSRAC